MILTENILNAGMSINGGWSVKQLRALGLTEKITPGRWFTKGWKWRLIGSKMSLAQIKEFLRLKDAHIKDNHKDNHQRDLFPSEDEQLARDGPPEQTASKEYSTLVSANGGCSGRSR